MYYWTQGFKHIFTITSDGEKYEAMSDFELESARGYLLDIHESKTIVFKASSSSSVSQDVIVLRNQGIHILPDTVVVETLEGQGKIVDPSTIKWQ